MTTIKLKVIDENIEFISTPSVYSGDVNTIITQFEFGKAWEGFTKSAVFYRDIKTPYQVVMEDDTCYIPHEVMQTEGRIFLGVFGVLDNKVKTSEVVYYDIGTGIITGTGIVPPSDDIWIQILSELATMRELAQTMKEENKTFQDSFTELGQELTDLTDMIQEKHDNGEFDGKSVIYGEENPSDEIGNDGDVYIKTTETEPYPYYLFTKDNGKWTPQFKTQGKDGFTGDTLPIGSQVVWNDDEPIPTGWSEVSYVDPELYSKKSLLINGDFQIWQRGESISTSGTKTEYIADMWCSSYQSTFTKVANGLKTSSNAHIIQLIPKLETGKKHSISISVNGVIYTDVFDGGTTKDTHEKYYYSTSRETAEKGGYSLIVIKLNAGDTLNWVDLFEGDVVYKHVKEDYAMALMRCQQFLQLVEYSCSNYCTTEQTQSIFEFPIVKMCRIPMITVLSTNSISGIDEISIVEEYSNGSIWVGYRLKVSGFLRINKRKLLLSCEPV